MYQYRKLLAKAVKEISSTTKQLSTKIMAVCHQQAPCPIVPIRNNINMIVIKRTGNSPLVPTGDLLLAAYMTMMTPTVLFRDWRRYHRLQKEANAVPMTMEEFNPWMKIVGSCFQGFIMSARSLYNDQNKQRFYMNFVAKYHGLSQSGSDHCPPLAG